MKEKMARKMDEIPDNPPWTMFFDGPLYQKYNEFMKTKDFSKILLNTKLRLANTERPEVVNHVNSDQKDPWEEEHEIDLTGNAYQYVSEEYFQRNKEDEKRRTRRTRAFIIIGIVIMAAIAFGTALVIHYFFVPPLDESNPKTFVNVSFSGNSTTSAITEVTQTTPADEHEDEINRMLDELLNHHHHSHDHDHDHFLNPDGKLFDGHFLTTTQETASQETTARGPTLQETTTREPTLQETTNREPTLQETTAREPTLQEVTSLEPTLQGTTTQETTIGASQTSSVAESTQSLPNTTAIHVLNHKPKAKNEEIHNAKIGVTSVTTPDSTADESLKQYTSTLDLNHMDFFSIDEFNTTTPYSTSTTNDSNMFAIDDLQNITTDGTTNTVTNNLDITTLQTTAEHNEAFVASTFSALPDVDLSANTTEAAVAKRNEKETTETVQPFTTSSSPVTTVPRSPVTSPDAKVVLETRTVSESSAKEQASPAASSFISTSEVIPTTSDVFSDIMTANTSRQRTFLPTTTTDMIQRASSTNEATDFIPRITNAMRKTSISEKETTAHVPSTTTATVTTLYLEETTSENFTSESTLPEKTTHSPGSTTYSYESTAVSGTTLPFFETTTLSMPETSTLSLEDTDILQNTTMNSEITATMARPTMASSVTKTSLPETTSALLNTTTTTLSKTSGNKTATTLQEIATSLSSTSLSEKNMSFFEPATILSETTSMPKTAALRQKTNATTEAISAAVSKSTTLISETTSSLPHTKSRLPNTTAALEKTTATFLEINETAAMLQEIIIKRAETSPELAETKYTLTERATAFTETTSSLNETSTWTTTLPITTTTTMPETTTLPENYNTIEMRDITSYTFENIKLNCNVKHAIKWKSLSVKNNEKWRPLEVTLFPSGDIRWSRAKTKRHDVTYDISNSTDGTGSNITISLIINDVQCRDRNTYICSLKSDIEDRAVKSQLITVGKPSRKIKLILGPSIIEDRAFRITASWQGGYPIPWANMSWTALDSNNKSYNLTDYGEYRDYELHVDHKFCQTTLQHSIVVFPRIHLNDTTVIVKPNLDTKKYFVDKSMETYLREVEAGVEKILVIPLNYCKNGNRDMSVPHPYTSCTKFLRCLPGDLVVQQCPTGTCFYEKGQKCA